MCVSSKHSPIYNITMGIVSLFFNEDLIAFKVDSVGRTILNWLQKESKHFQWVKATCSLGCTISLWVS